MEAKFIPYQVFDGQTNMDIDRQILIESANNNSAPTLRFYGWAKPTLTLGRNQPLKGIDIDFCKENNIDIIRRPTGGRAVLHQHELTYGFVVPVNFLKNGSSVLHSYQEISNALVKGFEKLDIKLSYPEYKKVSAKDGYCMSISTGSDLNYRGKKLIGSAQFRTQNYILQHGSILIDIDKRLLSGIFSTDKDDFGLTTIKIINPDSADVNLLSKAIKTGFEETFFLTF